MKKYFASFLILVSCSISVAQYYPASREISNTPTQNTKRCPAGFILDSNGNCMRLEADQIQN